MSRWTKNVKSKSQRMVGLKSTMRSSWVDYYEWLPNGITQDYGTFIMRVKKGGKKYEWKDIARDDAAQAVGGNARCQTNDPTGKKRWWIDKHPSLGASFHQICKFFQSKGYVIPARYDTLMDDIAFNPKQEYIKSERGRPNKTFDKWKRFSWTKKIPQKTPLAPKVSASYGDIFQDVVYDPKKKYVTETKGRPSKEYDTWKRFSRLKLAKYPKIGAP